MDLCEFQSKYYAQLLEILQREATYSFYETVETGLFHAAEFCQAIDRTPTGRSLLWIT